MCGLSAYSPYIVYTQLFSDSTDIFVLGYLKLNSKIKCFCGRNRTPYIQSINARKFKT